MIILAPTQLAVINVGLLKFSVLKFVPTYTVLYIIHGTSVGLFFYQEYAQMDFQSWFGFCFGFLFIFASLALLSLKPEPKETVDGALVEPLAPGTEGSDIEQSSSSTPASPSTKKEVPRSPSIKVLAN